MRATLALLTALGLCVAHALPAAAHGDEQHAKCKKGYVMTDNHKCVKKP